ncbi:hypothetical protein [Ferruginibacter sp. SUN106]|uniref:hypothetical protein n=1 Tax=Ferruginibacter sp. SUN106 TaxID=2978348 RepID=UPI003D363ADF
MKKVMLAILIMATGFAVNAQDNHNLTSPTVNTTLIAVVNRANWCAVCRANAERFAAVIMPYTAKGVTILFNDLTNDTTTAASKLVLQNANVYTAVYTVKRKGMGKAMQSCGLVKGKIQSTIPSGLVTFINSKTHRQLKQISIAVSSEEMKQVIDQLLNN